MSTICSVVLDLIFTRRDRGNPTQTTNQKLKNDSGNETIAYTATLSAGF